MTIHILFFWANKYEPMAEWLRLVVDSLVIWVQFAYGSKFFCSAAAILRGTEPVSAQTRSFLYCCALYNFSFLDFVSGDFALTGFWFLTWTSDFHCFGALRVWPGALTRPHVRSWHTDMVVIIAIVEPRSWNCKVPGHCFPLNYRKYF